LLLLSRLAALKPENGAGKTALVIGQASGALWRSGRALAFVALGLFGVWILPTLFSLALFEREAILTRWR
jgi:hypothetical protein